MQRPISASSDIAKRISVSKQMTTTRNLVLVALTYAASVTTFAILAHPAVAQHPAYPGNPVGTPHLQVHQVAYGSEFAGGYACNHCGYSANNPPAQPQVAGGRCQVCGVAVDCADNCGRPQTIKDLHRYNIQPLSHGEFMGPVRVPSTIDYRIRVGDSLRFIFLRSQEVAPGGYRLQVGDELQITSLSDDTIKIGDLTQRVGIAIQQDGTLDLPIVGKQPAAGQTIPQLRENLERVYSEKIKIPGMDVVPVATNSTLESLINSVDARAGSGGQNFIVTVTADGKLRLPKLGEICVLGMTLNEIKREINLRYREVVSGLEIEPTIESTAPHFIFVFGEVTRPGRHELTTPTTVTGGLALAEGVINARGNRRQIVIFRRAEDWRLIATVVDLAGAHYGKTLTPADEIWLRDSDLIIVPPKPVTRMADFTSEFFTRGIYAAFPFAQIGEGFNANAFAN